MGIRRRECAKSSRRDRWNWRAPRVVEVREDSPCREAVKEGDLLLEVNGRRPRDVLDLMQWGDGAVIRLRLQRGDRVLKLRVRKEEGRPLGLVFEDAVFDGIITCRNRCLFCFVDQMPPGLRPSLYLKDDDYRLSFWYGNFITLNNLDHHEVRRIVDLRLSPLYVSLHSTDPRLRSRLMGGRAERGLEILRLFLERGIEVHLQVVCCPGINDGPGLRHTFEEVLTVYTGASLGVVPVGLTRLAGRKTPSLKPHDRSTASSVLDLVEEFQSRALELLGRRLFHASDEFYLLAGREFPPAEDYEGFPQLENGIGLARKFLEEIVSSPCREYCLKEEALKTGTDHNSVRGGWGGPGVLTGVAGEPVIRRALSLAKMEGVEVLVARNEIFGGTVTATPLLGGRDILHTLREKGPACRDILIPNTLLKEERFLDELTVEDVFSLSGYRIHPTEVRGDSFLSALRWHAFYSQSSRHPLT